MTETNKNLPLKSNVWIAGNIAATILFGGFLIKFLTGYFTTNWLFSVLIGIISLYLGAKLGVIYVSRYSLLNKAKIKSISLIVSVILFLLYLLTQILNKIAGNYTGNLVEFSFTYSILYLLSVIPVYVFVRFELNNKTK